MKAPFRDWLWWRRRITARCPAVHDAYRCDLPDGHKGRHRDSTAAGSPRYWPVYEDTK